MARRIFKQNFANDYNGIDGLTSSLEEEVGKYNRAVNLEMAVGNSLRGRVGSQVAGHPAFIFGIFPWNYTRTQNEYKIVYDVGGTLSTTKTLADGASINRLIGINQQIWVLDTMDITITQSLPGTYLWYSTVTSPDINFVIKKNGTSILDTSLTNGLSGFTTVSIYSLLNTINGLADLAINTGTRGVCPPFAIVNGSQTTTLVGTNDYGTTYQVTVDAGHTFNVGDVICFPFCNFVAPSVLDTKSSMVGGIVTAIGATTINYTGPKVTVLDNLVLGYMGQSAAAFPISTVSSETSGSIIMSFPYWKLIPEGDASDTQYNYGYIYERPYKTALNKTTANSATSAFYAPPNAVSAAGNLYIAASCEDDVLSPIYGVNVGYSNSLIKIDGRQAFRAGLYAPVVTATPIAGGAIPAGNYKYKAFLRRVDAQGNIFEGPCSDVVTAAYSGGNLQGTVTITPDDYSDANGFCGRSILKATPTSSPGTGTAFTVDNAGAGAFIQPGDLCFTTDDATQTVGLTDNATGAALGNLHKTVCTFYDGTAAPHSIKVEEAFGALQIRDNSAISTGLTVVILRTAIGGNQYYVLGEIPSASITGASATVLTDNVTDAVLTTKEQYLEVELGKEHNFPLGCSIVCQHQGGLVIARGFTAPNTVHFSTAEGIEYFPTASNSFDVPSTQSGYITAIASDTNDRLAVFKNRAYYDVAGDLDGGSFSVNVKNEGDYGVASHASLKRVAGSLLGVCELGYVTIFDGNLTSNLFEDLNTRLINQSYYFQWAVAENDAFSRNYICSIPTSSEPVTHIVDYSRKKIKTFERTYSTQIDPGGGIAIVNNVLYYLSITNPYNIFKRLPRFNGDSPGSGDGDSFVDNTNAISYILESSPISFGEPGQLKTPIRMRLWSLANDYVKDGWSAFSTLIETGASAIASYVGGVNPNASSSTVTFTTANDAFKDVKLVNCKTHFYIVRLTTNTIKTAPFWTGYEIMFDDNYKKEDLIK